MADTLCPVLLKNKWFPGPQGAVGHREAREATVLICRVPGRSIGNVSALSKNGLEVGMIRKRLVALRIHRENASGRLPPR